MFNQTTFLINIHLTKSQDENWMWSAEVKYKTPQTLTSVQHKDMINTTQTPDDQNSFSDGRYINQYHIKYQKSW